MNSSNNNNNGLSGAEGIPPTTEIGASQPHPQTTNAEENGRNETGVSGGGGVSVTLFFIE